MKMTTIVPRRESVTVYPTRRERKVTLVVINHRKTLLSSVVVIDKRESVTVYTPTIIIVPIIVVKMMMTIVHRRESVTVYPTLERWIVLIFILYCLNWGTITIKPMELIEND